MAKSFVYVLKKVKESRPDLLIPPSTLEDIAAPLPDERIESLHTLR